jgi:hypothetical protein
MWVGPKVSGLTHKSRAKWKMLRGIYSASYGEVNVSVSLCFETRGDYIEKQQCFFISVTLKSWSGRKHLDPPSYVHYFELHKDNTGANNMWTMSAFCQHCAEYP